MVQQTTIRKNNEGLAFLERIFGNSAVNGEVKRSIGFLRDDYAAAMKIAGNLYSHAKWIPYPFLVDRIKRISDEVKLHAEIFRAKIIELGGQIPQATLESRDASKSNYDGHAFGQNVKRLVADMEEHSDQCETLLHQKNMVIDVQVVELLNAVIVDMQRQKDELTDIIMRIS